MKNLILWVLLPFLFADTSFNAWTAQNLKGRVKGMTEVKFETIQKNNTWIKTRPVYGSKSPLTYFTPDGKQKDYMLIDDKSHPCVEQVIEYSKDSLLIGLQTKNLQTKKNEEYKITKSYKNTVVINAVVYGPGNQIVKEVVNTLDDKGKITRTIIYGPHKTIIYQAWYQYNNLDDVAKKTEIFSNNKKYITTMDYIEFDGKKNWTEKIETLYFDLAGDSNKTLVKRIIEYY